MHADFVLKDGDPVGACLYVLLHGGRTMYITQMFFFEHFQNKKIGKQYLKNVLMANHPHVSRYELLCRVTNEIGKSFWERVGFNVDHVYEIFSHSNVRVDLEHTALGNRYLFGDPKDRNPDAKRSFHRYVKYVTSQV